MGNLSELWLDLPDDIGDQETLVAHFKNFFGRNWSDVMFKAEQSFDFHQHWNSYLAVSELEPLSNLLLPTLLSELEEQQLYQVLLG